MQQRRRSIPLLLNDCPHTQLLASGEAVGLPEGQMGNSEVGHLNLGAGRVVYQDSTRISKAIREGDFFKNQVLLVCHGLRKAERKGALHLMGLLSDGGVHSRLDHIYALLDMAKKQGDQESFIFMLFWTAGIPRPQAPSNISHDLESRFSEIGLGTHSIGFGQILRHGPR